MSPTHAPSPCVEPGCFHLATHKGRCAQCQLIIRGGGRVAYDQQRGSARERGYGRAWEKRRKRHLEAEPFCRSCTHPGKAVDHVIPHRGVQWLFDLEGNLQTLCLGCHTKKTMAERTIPIGMMYPLDLPEPPHYRPTRVLCGPALGYTNVVDGGGVLVWNSTLGPALLATFLEEVTDVPFTLLVDAPRTAERAFWSHVMDCTAKLIEPPPEWLAQGEPKAWWDDFMLDGRAEAAMRRRTG